MGENPLLCACFEFLGWSEGKKEPFSDFPWAISYCTSQEPAMVDAEVTKYFNSYY